MGKISLDKIEIFAKIGAFEYERKMRQKFLITVSFELDLVPAAKDDDLNKTVDYSQIVKLCREKAENSYQLIETLAVEIAEDIHQKFEIVSDIHVEVAKPEVQLGSKLAGVSVSHFIP